MAFPVRRVDAPRRRPPGTARVSARGDDGEKSSVTPAESSRPDSRPDLRLVPRPRLAVNAVMLLAVMIVGLMLAAVVLHTRLAERQLEIDRLETEVTEARERFDVLRQQRAELRSPTRLALASAELGMYAPPQTEFLTVDGQTLAEIIAAAGSIEDLPGLLQAADPLEQIREVKAASEGSP